MGGATALGGFLLVFLGVVLSALATFDASVSRSVLAPYKFAAKLVMGAFLLCILIVFGALLWMVTDSVDWLYWPLVVAFIGELVAVVILSLYVLSQIVLGD